MPKPSLPNTPSSVRDRPRLTCAVRDRRTDQTWIITLSGELSIATAGRLTKCLNDAETSARLVVVDLRQLSFMDGAGLGALVSAEARARKNGRRLALMRGPRQVERMLEIAGLGDLFENADPSLFDTNSASLSSAYSSNTTRVGLGQTLPPAATSARVQGQA